jgi:signal transduction histidine kinase
LKAAEEMRLSDGSGQTKEVKTLVSGRRVGSVGAVSEPLWRTRREAIFYLLPVATLTFLYIALLAWGPEPDGKYPAIDLIVAITLITLLIFRRRIPLVLGGVVALVSVGYFVLAQIDPTIMALKLDDPWLPIEAPFATYAVARYRNDAIGWTLIGGLTALACRPWDPNINVISGGILLTAVPALLGLYIGAHRRLVVELTGRAERAEREQHLLAEQARAEERVRLAEEMHDVVTHRISLMVLHAGALGLTAPDQHTREAAEGLRQAGCQALNELRDLVGVLRNAETVETATPSTTGQSPVADLSTLVSESESVGIPVNLIEDGDPENTSPTVGRTAFRIVQESLTNIRKHAPGSTATVNVRYGTDRVRLTIRNTPATQTVDSGLSGSGSGTGLLGLRQRVELVGGSLYAGPKDDGGFEVDAILPAYVPTGEKVRH